MPRKVWTSLRLARINLGLRGYKVHTVHHSYGGIPLDIQLADSLAEGWYDREWPTLPEISFLCDHGLKPGATVFDLGAHQCVVALMLSRIVGPAGRVLAIEANAHNARIGQRNCTVNNAENLKVVHAAVAETSGRLLFNRGLNGAADDGKGEWGSVEVESFSIDDLASRYGPPDVLFIDTEGFEMHALKGAARTLARRPDCFVEMHLGGKLEGFGGDAASVLRFFPKREFDLYLAAHPVDDYSFVPIEEPAQLPNHRCYLIAVGRRDAELSETGC